ncbi:adenosylcobinamide amidohydrolase [Paenibacillus tarimensis]|uniref:adenosylcobinamide amidohydrolase n=1 Tax=Paenibacillus tarimensis TaxID=416012 RepID=UPI001F4626D0|nr:adenosylcobinamide amidohydrolase [Paenibacillus tarimensis]MCF2944794.1 adenosylcobinamide amidohydrolase [Paenibacillus tarimensis]
MQPFRSGRLYHADCWPDLTFTLKEDAISVSGAGRLDCASSAILNGGFYQADTFVNRRVALDFDCSDPVTDLRHYLNAQGVDASRTIGLLTAADLTRASVQEARGDGFRMVVCTTAGLGNAAKAGIPRTVFPSYRPGTINTMIFLDGLFSPAAMLNLMCTATEAKSSALWDLGVQDAESAGKLATGTTTDALVVAATQSRTYGLEHVYGGTAAAVGHAAGRLVYLTVKESASSADK